MTKWVYDFAEGSRDMRELLGGKGANVAEITRVLSPPWSRRLHDHDQACVEYMRAVALSRRRWPAGRRGAGSA